MYKSRFIYMILGRLGWTDEIDFDLNGELTTNNYLNK